MKRYELIVIGAGPAGLCAAIEAATNGMQVVVYDENSRPGGQLFKQIHKFFGAKEHKAKERGFRIGEKLLEEARELGVEVVLNATVMGVFANKEITVMIEDRVEHIKGNELIIATGASENMVPFPGWTLPGVIGAGAAQTMMNLHGIKPGNKVLMVGSGNVGLVVGFQLIQAGCKLEAIIDASPRVGGYGVHASKLARLGVPFYMSHTVKEVFGEGCVQGVSIVEVDKNWQQVAGSEKTFAVDTICIAVGLSPMSQLAKISGCMMEDSPAKGGLVPSCNEYGETSIPGIYAAGDVSGIEEASSAMLKGRIAGSAISYKEGYLDETIFREKQEKYCSSLEQLRGGMFGHGNKGRTDLLSTTEEGFALSLNLLENGFLSDLEIDHYPGVVSQERRKKGIVPVIECTQNIPCNPCQDACEKGCIKVGTVITNLPIIDETSKCTGCGMCVAACSGQAIFLVNEDYAPGYATVGLPYEFRPLPQIGEKGIALDRSGKAVGEAEVISIKSSKALDETSILTIKVSEDLSMKARFFKRSQEVCYE